MVSELTSEKWLRINLREVVYPIWPFPVCQFSLFQFHLSTPTSHLDQTGRHQRLYLIMQQYDIIADV